MVVPLALGTIDHMDVSYLSLIFQHIYHGVSLIYYAMDSCRSDLREIDQILCEG